MASEKVTFYRTNDEKTEFIEQLPKTVSSQVYDSNNEQFLDETLIEITEHSKNSTNKKHIEVVSNAPNNLSDSGILFMVDGSSPDVPAMTTVDELNNQVGQLLADINSVGVNAKSRGLIPDNTSVDNKEAFQQLFTAVDVDTIKIPEGVYTTSKIDVALRNKRIVGVQGKTVIKSTDDIAIQFVGSTYDVVFEDITFETIDDSWDSLYGVLTALDVSMKRIKFIRCSFKSVKGNGVKFVNERNYTSEDISFVDCVFQDLGRMGVEFQNHPPEGFLDIARFFNINFTDCVFNNIGTTGDDGMGISLSGLGQTANITRCTFTDCNDIGIESIGATYVNIDHCTFLRTSKSFNPINITNDRPNDFITITNNKSIGNLGRINLYKSRHLIFANNTFVGIQDVYFRDAYHCKVIDNVIISNDSSSYALMFDKSGNNEIRGNTLDTSPSTNNWSVLRFYGENSTENFAINNKFFKGSGGETTDEMSGATKNLLVDNYFESNLISGFDQNVLRETKRENVIWINGNGPSLVSEVLISFDTPVNWRVPFSLEIECLSQSSGQLIHAKVRLVGIYGSELTFREENIATPTNAAITITVINNHSIKLTCTATVNASSHSYIIKGLMSDTFTVDYF